MVIQCPSCRSMFRIGDEKVANPGVRVRCSKCKHIFPVPRDTSLDLKKAPAAPYPTPSGLMSPAMKPFQTPPPDGSPFEIRDDDLETEIDQALSNLEFSTPGEQNTDPLMRTLGPGIPAKRRPGPPETVSGTMDLKASSKGTPKVVAASVIVDMAGGGRSSGDSQLGASRTLLGLGGVNKEGNRVIKLGAAMDGQDNGRTQPFPSLPELGEEFELSEESLFDPQGRTEPVPLELMDTEPPRPLPELVAKAASPPPRPALSPTGAKAEDPWADLGFSFSPTGDSPATANTLPPRALPPPEELHFPPVNLAPSDKGLGLGKEGLDLSSLPSEEEDVNRTMPGIRPVSGKELQNLPSLGLASAGELDFFQTNQDTPSLGDDDSSSGLELDTSPYRAAPEPPAEPVKGPPQPPARKNDIFGPPMGDEQDEALFDTPPPDPEERPKARPKLASGPVPRPKGGPETGPRPTPPPPIRPQPQVQSAIPADLAELPGLRPKGGNLARAIAILILLLNGFATFVFYRNDWKADFRKMPQMLSLAFGQSTDDENLGLEGLEIKDMNHTVYFNSRNERMLVIEGRVENQSGKKKKLLHVMGKILDPQDRVMLVKEVPCGNTFSPEQLREFLSPATIDSAYSQLGMGTTNLNIPNGSSIPFMIVFFPLPDELERQQPKLSVIVSSGEDVD